MSARMGASRAFAKSRNQEILKRRAAGASGGSFRSRSSNSDSKGNWLNYNIYFIDRKKLKMFSIIA